jgi:dimethylhistidine N-methyltransferase
MSNVISFFNRKQEEPVCHDYGSASARFREDVLSGLAKNRRQIPPKYFYDQEGSRLFDAICQLPEYYPTRTEIGLLKRYGREMAQCVGEGSVLVEFGSGSSIKIRLLLEALQPAAYLPIDISREHLFQSAKQLAADYPAVMVQAICADYTGPLTLPEGFINKQKAGFFPGSSIGNFELHEAHQFLQRIASLLGSGSGLLIGVDLKKDVDILTAAYNDSRGITAAFNLNLLRRINRELQGDFDLNSFEHRALYNVAKGRVEMHLVSCKDQVVTVGDHIFTFQTGESVHTENSYKYSIEEFQQLARAAGFQPQQVWCDEQGLFSVHYLSL